MDVGKMRQSEHEALSNSPDGEGKPSPAADAPQGPVIGPGWRIRLFHVFHLLTRPMTLGMRCAAFDAEGRIFLVRHTYLPGWHMPGGGIDPGETAEEGLRRECREEGHLELGAVDLFGIYLNRVATRRDHVLLYVARNVRQSAPRPPDREIAESGFFAPEALPEATSAATRRRLAELGGHLPPHPHW